MTTRLMLLWVGAVVLSLPQPAPAQKVERNVQQELDVDARLRELAEQRKQDEEAKTRLIEEVSQERIVLGAEEYQELPAYVREVFIGPDQRTWYVCSDPPRAVPRGGAPASVDQVKKIISEEFSKETPQLVDCHIAFFERGGRVWFRPYASASVLLAFDGKTWIERKCPTGELYRGLAPNHGAQGRGGFNAESDGALWFPTQRGIDRFDGTSWSYLKFHNEQAFNHVQLLIGKDPSRVVAVGVGSFCGVWICEKDKARQWFPEPGEEKSIEPNFPTMGAITPTGDVWLLGYARAPLLLRAKAERLPLASEVYDTKASTCEMGPFLVGEAFGMYSDNAGRVIVSANVIKRAGSALGKGSILCDAEGRWSFLAEKDFPRIFHNSTNLDHGGWITIDDGKRVWFSGTNEVEPCLLDLETMTVLDRVERDDLTHLVAVKKDGTMFLRPRKFVPEGQRWDHHSSPIVVVRR